MAAGEIWHGMFPFYPGAFFELSPFSTPITTLASRNGLKTTPNKLYTQTYHTNTNHGTSANTKPDMATVTYGSSAFTTGSNCVQIFFEGAFESWARRGDQQFGRVEGWQGATNPSFEPSALARAKVEALDKIKRNLEWIAREGTFQLGGGGGEGTSGTVQDWRQRGFRKDANINVGTAAGAVAGAGTLGTTGTLTHAVVLNTMEAIWADKLWTNGRPLLAISNSTAVKQLVDIFKTEYNYGKNGDSINEVGVDLQRFRTNFGAIDIAMSYDMPSTELYLLNMDYMNIVTRPVPGKGVLFEEPVIGNGVAGDGVGYYTEMGLDYGVGYAHGKIFGIGSAIAGGTAVVA